MAPFRLAKIEFRINWLDWQFYWTDRRVIATESPKISCNWAEFDDESTLYSHLTVRWSPESISAHANRAPFDFTNILLRLISLNNDFGSTWTHFLISVISARKSLASRSESACTDWAMQLNLFVLFELLQWERFATRNTQQIHQPIGWARVLARRPFQRTHAPNARLFSARNGQLI